MPLFVPLADLLGLSRQVPVLAYQTGAGLAESVARSVCGLVRTTTVLSKCDRGADEKWRRQSSE
jgi:uncharacterized ion transporter superfamily protein YfcC